MTPAEGRIGLGADLHRLVEGRPLRLGTIEIPHGKGLLGHSDGDVLCHAIADSLLGAAGLGEIGEMFPEDDPSCAGLAGAEMLRRVRDRVSAAGWRIGNVDAVVRAEEPRLSPHREGMLRGIAGALAIEAGRVGLKIKSNEGCDAVGRGEAIEAFAISRLETG